MRYSNLDRIHHNKKASRITIGKNEPNVREGSDGDITIREITGKGIFLFVKFNNNWYSRVLFDGASEIAMQNPGRTMQLFGWNPDAKAYSLLNANDVLDLEFGSPGKMELKLGTRGATSLNQINRDTALRSTNVFYHAVESSVIEEGRTLTVSSGTNFNIADTVLDIQAMLKDINDIKSDIEAVKADVETATNLSNDAFTRANRTELRNDKLTDALDEIMAAYFAFYEAVSTTQIDGVNIVNSTNDPYNTAFLDVDNIETS